MPYQQSADMINPNTFPYMNAVPKMDLPAFLDRVDRLRDAMTDPVGPSGVAMMVDEGSIANIAFHLAMAGGDVDDEKSYIWPDVDEDDAGMFRLINWRLKSEFDPPPKAEVDPEEVERMAARAREELDKQLPKEVRDLLLQQIAKEFTVDTTEPDDEKKGGGA
ncbi:phage gene 29 protein family protein [Mycolicibacterium fluoranthenivorans]|uniref:DUF2744 domain-containing protein n=1 Tax=Mycolicibacterium fluoranthenivorans TaxID=258505 RepID=A0A7X5U460_9MYCO|nr:hypothetical protein [Mycolicibacterium fluoranthenivorans]MCV7358472.1 hypothetical protein [Mycolicibacterium fluoranthenivorans]NIH98048.1 hypothetical protein [Mycolicibacterium fluoranthenivorans]